jgi:hypothetical protein
VKRIRLADRLHVRAVQVREVPAAWLVAVVRSQLVAASAVVGRAVVWSRLVVSHWVGLRRQVAFTDSAAALQLEVLVASEARWQMQGAAALAVRPEVSVAA